VASPGREGMFPELRGVNEGHRNFVRPLFIASIRLGYIADSKKGVDLLY
jgi:hypothetical protein